MRLIGISGSLRRNSYNHRLLGAAASLLPPGVELELYDRLRDIPPFSQDDPAGEAVQHLRRAVQDADGLVVSTPEYNGSIPGQLKNALDWLSRPFPDNALRDKPAAVMGASTGLFGAVWAQAELRKVLERSGAKVFDEDMPVGQAHVVLGPGGNIDPETGDALRAHLGSFVSLALRQQPAPAIH